MVEAQPAVLKQEAAPRPRVDRRPAEQAARFAIASARSALRTVTSRGRPPEGRKLHAGATLFASTKPSVADVALVRPKPCRRPSSAFGSGSPSLPASSSCWRSLWRLPP